MRALVCVALASSARKTLARGWQKRDRIGGRSSRDALGSLTSTMRCSVSSADVLFNRCLIDSFLLSAPTLIFDPRRYSVYRVYANRRDVENLLLNICLPSTFQFLRSFKITDISRQRGISKSKIVRPLKK